MWYKSCLCCGAVYGAFYRSYGICNYYANTFIQDFSELVEGIEDLAAGDLGSSVASVLEDNGRFADLPPPLLALIEHFDQKGVAVGENLVQLDGLQHPPAIAAEASGAVMSLEAQHQASKGVSYFAQDLALQAPIKRTPSINVARTDNQLSSRR